MADGTTPERRGPGRLPPRLADRVPGLGRPGRRRAVVVVVRPRGGLQGARASTSSSRSAWRWPPRSPSSSSPRRTRASSSTSRSAAAATWSPRSCSGRGAGVVSGSGADRRLRAHHHHLDRRRRGRGLQLRARRRCTAGSCRWSSRPSALLVVLNLRGVKESVTVLAPIFLLFLVTHVILIGGAVISPGSTSCRPSRTQVRSGLSQATGDPGAGGDARRSSCAPTRWARGTYTGIEAVSQRPADHARAARWRPAKRTMVLHGRLAGPHRRRHHPRATCCCTSTPVAGQDDERGAGRRVRRRLPALGVAARPVVRADHPRSPRRCCSSSPRRPASSTARG